MELPLKSSAMTLFLFQFLVFCSEVAYTLVPDADQVAENLKVSHFDCDYVDRMQSIHLDFVNTLKKQNTYFKMFILLFVKALILIFILFKYLSI